VNTGQHWLKIDLVDLVNFDEDLSKLLIDKPGEMLPLVRRPSTTVVGRVCGGDGTHTPVAPPRRFPAHAH